MFLNESDFPVDTICEITGVFSEKAVERGAPDMTLVTLKGFKKQQHGYSAAWLPVW